MRDIRQARGVFAEQIGEPGGPCKEPLLAALFRCGSVLSPVFHERIALKSDHAPGFSELVKFPATTVGIGDQLN